MKKNKFLSGLGAKLAFAIVVALATTMFTSCEKDNINVSVTPVKATAYVNILVVADNNDVTSSATISSSEGTVTKVNNNYQVKLEGNPTLADKTIKIDASYNGMTGSKSVAIKGLKAGETASAIAEIILSSTPEE